MPKSRIFTTSAPSSSGTSMMFDGFRSRCTTPSLCASRRPRATWRKMRSVSCTGSDWTFFRRSASVSPGKYSIAMKYRSSASPSMRP